MKAKIKYSKFATWLTIVICVALYIGCIATVHEGWPFYIMLFMYLILILAGAFYGVIYLKADDKYLVLGSIFKRKRIPLRDVMSVELFKPTMGAIRICGSSGFMGYWGLFREGDIGRYYVFYGKASDCFFVRMKNGDKYVVGCENPQDMVNYIKAHLI